MRNFFSKLIAFFTSGKAQAALEKAAELATNPQVISVAENIAAITPTRADDEIIAACKTYGLPVAQHYLATPVEKRGMVLLDIALTVLTPLLPGISGKVLSLAVSAAVAGLEK